jgi:hypothetical protein
MDFEQLAVSAARLPRPVVPDDFVARVMNRIDPPVRPRWRRLLEPIAALWTPRTVQWNLAGAAVAACVALVAGLLAASAWRQTGAAPPEGGTSASAAAPQDSRPVLVRLVVLQPGATMVHAAGDFNGWDPARTPLTPVADGAWAVTLPLEPGRYEYMFVVDGTQWIADPFAIEQNDDGFGSRNAVLDVRPAGASL